MKLERLNNVPFNAIKPNIVAIFVFFVTAASFIEIFPLNLTWRNGKPSFSLRLLGGEQYLANHLRASQSARAKSTIHLCGIY